MHGPRKLAELVEAIYDAGLDPSLWNNVVTGIRDFVGGQACGLFSKDSISKFGVTHYAIKLTEAGFGPEMLMNLDREPG